MLIMMNYIFKYCFSWLMVKAAVFELINELQDSRKDQTYFPSAMYITNTVIHITIFLSIPSLSIIGILSALSNATLVYVFSGFILMLVLQILIYLVKRVQLYLSYQLSFYRFVVGPLLTYSVLLGSKNGILPQALVLIILVINKIWTSLLSRTVLYEFHRNYTLNIMQSSIVFQFDTFQILLISNCFISDGSQIIFAGLALASSLLTTYRHFLRMESNTLQYKILHFTNLIHVVLTAFYLSSLVFVTLHPIYSFIAVTPLLLFIFFAIRDKKKSIQNNIQNLLANKLEFQEFLEAVDSFLTLTKHDPSSNRKRKLTNYIYAICLHHKTKCLMSNCELESPSTQEQLKNITTKSLLQITHKILKKIEWHFEEYHSKASDDLVITFIFLKFYAEYLPNKIKMQSLLNELNQNNLNLPNELELSKYKDICSNIQNIDNIDVIKDEEIYVEFQTAMVSTLNLMIEFWSEFGEEKVDLGKIMSASMKLFPFKAKIEKIVSEQIKVQKFTTFKILKLYALYLSRILNKFEMASKVEDIQHILSNLLKDKQDIQYLSKESEAGFVVICLSQSKLGDIFMANEKACDIFRYNKKEMLNLRVNAIMPSVISDIHDQILTDFLKKKRKKYNTDQRLLFGKDGNGYIFPLELQLQRASFSSNDQYIFIASVTPAKLKSTPILCIVDNEGEITDYSASFRNIFFKNLSSKNYNRNIQQIIPSYFDSDYIQKSENVRLITQYINNKKIGDIQARFEVSPILVKTVHQGYLIKMSYNNQKTVSTYRSLNFTGNLKQLLQRKEVKCMQNTYDHLSNCYYMTGSARNINLRSNGPQFTLPFLSYQDMAKFAISNEVKTFGKDIKTIRLSGNHFERIDQQQSFHSDSFANDDKLDVRAKIQELKHKFNKKQDKGIIFTFKVLTIIIITFAMIVAVFCYTLYVSQVSQQQEFLKNFDIQKKILYYLPEYIVSFTCAKAGINSKFYLDHLKVIQPILIQNIIQSQIQQVYKQQIMKIVYLKSPEQLVDLLETNTFSATQSDSSTAQIFRVTWSTLIAISALLILNFMVMFYYYNQILFSIYTLFLSLKETSIKKIEESCRALIQKIYFQSQENVQKDEDKKVIQDQQQENQLEKIKHFKNTSRKQDFVSFLKLIVPIIFLTGFIFFLLFESSNLFQLYKSMKDQHNTIFESVPVASIEITKTILKVIDSISLDIDNYYEKYYQLLQMTVLQFNQYSQSSNYLDLLYGNICINSNVIKPQMALSCNTLGNGILTYGISSTMNFIAQQLKDVSVKNQITTQNIELLFTLQFLFLNPALMSIEDSMEDVLISKIISFGSFFQSMIILLISLYVAYGVYLMIYPFHIIEKEIKLTNQMLSLMPDNAEQDLEQNSINS